MRLWELLPGSRLGYLRWAPLSDLVTGGVVQIWTSEILQKTMVFNDDLHGDSEILYI